jgi:hypothetical protein
VHSADWAALPAAAQALFVDTYFNDGWRGHWRYSGTRSELIAAGLAADGEFPGERRAKNGQLKRKGGPWMHYGREVGLLVRSRPPTGIRYWAWVMETEAEWEAREKTVGVAEWNADAATALQQAANTIDQMPGSAAAFRDALVRGAERVFERLVRPGLKGDGDCVNALFAKCVPGSFRYSNDTIEEVDELWGEMMNA